MNSNGSYPESSGSKSSLITRMSELGKSGSRPPRGHVRLTLRTAHSITAHYANDRFAPITANRELIRFLPNPYQ